jgi:hypothetical protein
MLITLLSTGVHTDTNWLGTSKLFSISPIFGIELSILGYRGRVPRTDENGRQLRALLDYLLDGQLRTQQIHRALGISSSSYYRRIREDDYPNADELHKLANRFSLSFADLQIRLGFVTREDLEGVLAAIAPADGRRPTLRATRAP